MQLGLVTFKSNADIEREQSAQVGQPPPDPYAGLVLQIGSYIEACWQAAKTAKEAKVEPEMLASLRLRRTANGISWRGFLDWLAQRAQPVSRRCPLLGQ